MFIRCFKDCCIRPLWRLHTPGHIELPVLPQQIQENFRTFQTLQAAETAYRFDGGTASRLILSADNRIVILAEKLCLNNQVSTYTSFAFELTEDFSINVADHNRLVMRSGDQAAKLFHLASAMDDQDTLSSSGLMLPDGIPERKLLRFSLYSGLHNFGNRQTSLYGLVQTERSQIRKWHIKRKPGGFYAVTSPDGVCRYQILTDGESVTLRKPETGNAISGTLIHPET